MKKILLLITCAIGAQAYADVVTPGLKTGFFKALYTFDMSVVHFINYDPAKRPREIEKMQDVFFRVSEEDSFEQAGIGFIGVNIQNVTSVKKSIKKRFNVDLDIPKDGSVVMLFADGEFVKDESGKPVMLEGTFSKRKFQTELTQLIDKYFGESIDDTLERAEQAQPKVRYVPRETVRYVSSAPAYTYASYAYPRRRFYARPYFGLGFGRGWGWGGRRWGGFGGLGGFGLGGFGGFGRGGIGFGIGW